MPSPRSTDDTVDLPKVSDDDDGNNKKCCQCGKDLRGHRRFKDSVGYWCKDCHRVDKARNTMAEARCPDCGRMRPLDKLYTMPDGVQVCSACKKERQKEAEKYEIKAAVEAEEKWQQRKPLYIMFAVLIVLGVIVLVREIFRFFG